MSPAEDQKGRCVSCGFLGIRPSPGRQLPLEYYEVSPQDRAQGNLLLYIPAPLVGQIQTDPACLRRAADLAQELGERTNKAATALLEKDRQCDKWHAYTPGLSPKDHLDEFKAKELEGERRRFELRITWILGALAGVSIFVQLAFPNGWKWLMRIFGAQ